MDGKDNSDQVSDINEEMLATGGEAVVHTKWQRAWLNCVHVQGLWDGELVSNELRYLAEETFKQTVKRAPQFFLTASS